MTQTSTFEPEPKSLKIPAKIASEASFTDRKSTRLNSSHLVISYAVFCLKKRQNQKLVEAYIGRSYAYVSKGEIDKALNDANDALRLDPNSAPCLPQPRGNISAPT